MQQMRNSDFFEKLRAILAQEVFEIPENFKGAGAPGTFLEHLIGIVPGVHDGPDTGIWELKFHGGNAPITLLHLTPEPAGVMSEMVHAYGWKDKNGRISFRHTIWGSSDKGFKTVNRYDKVTIININSCSDNTFQHPFWTHNRLLNAFSYKLRRVVIVKGIKRGRIVHYKSAHLYWEPDITGIITAITNGIIAIDFDARTSDAGKGLRDHGTKFRIKINDLSSIYINNKPL